MRRITVLAIITAALFLSVASAALPPHYQRVAELDAILSHEGVVGTFGISRSIDSVEYLDVDLYRVTSGSCHMFVRIVGIQPPANFVGARQFEVVPGELHCA